MGLIIPKEYLDRELPTDANDEDSAIENAITEASVFCNTWAERYLEWTAYTDDGDDEYTINAPYEIKRICTQVAKILYWQSQSAKHRDGLEEADYEQRLEYYRQLLKQIEYQEGLLVYQMLKFQYLKWLLLLLWIMKKKK